ncbi:hypothetical protein C2U70_05905 [Bradyrhizobium guangdongense]|nr:hypothetical protein C2U70_05905 [Bradyrhizobium guangdongense]
MNCASACHTLSVVPDKRKRRSGTHSHRIEFGEDSWLPVRATTSPWGYGSRIGARLGRACPGRRLKMLRTPEATPTSAYRRKSRSPAPRSCGRGGCT